MNQRHFKTFSLKKFPSGALALALTLISAKACFAGDANAFIVLPESQLTSLSHTQKEKIDKLRRSRDFLDVQTIKVNENAFHETTITVNLEGKEIELSRTYLSSDDPTHYAWGGRNKLHGEEAIFCIDGSNISATIRALGKTFEIRPIGDGIAALVDLDMTDANKATDRVLTPDELSQEDASHKLTRTEAETMVAAASPEAIGIANGPVNVRVLVAYSNHAAASLGGRLTTEIDKAIQQINEANRTGNVLFTTSLAGTILVPYNGPYDAHSTLTSFRSMPDVKKAHDSLAADLMVMLEDIVDTNEAGESAGINVTAQNAYAVVSAKYMTSNLTFAHEVG